MKRAVHAALSGTRAGARVLETRRSVLAAVAPVCNRLAGCRIRTRGARNRVDWAAARRIRSTSVTIAGDGNVVAFGKDARLESCRIVVRGSGNRIEIGSSLLTGSGITISGDGNTVTVGDGCMLLSLGMVCEDDGNTIGVGDATQVHGVTELAAIEGTRIDIGGGCLSSGGVHVRTGDSHALTDLGGIRINPSADIVLGDRVWLGMNAVVLKGATIAEASVVGACAVVTGRFDEPHCALAGNPARVVRRGVDWRAER